MNNEQSGPSENPIYRDTYECVIGIEIHCQLATATKIFCGCRVDVDSEPNYRTCPVCLGMPGALPVLNKKAVESAILLGAATNCTIRERSVFARKNYFYPDLPKGYQISQFDKPVCEHGFISLPSGKKVGITRIHMEEDAGKSTHTGDESLVDLNRAGTPLLEIVSEPDLRSPAEAVAYMKEIYAIVKYLDITNGNMEQGNFRCDSNISIRKPGQPFGVRTELKNMNSFKFIEKAIHYEISRHIDVVESGAAVFQESRGYNAERNETFSMRSKEDAHDYRYFPDPDLPDLIIANQWKNQVLASLPELPRAKMDRFTRDYQLSSDDAFMLCEEKSRADYFERTYEICQDVQQTLNWLKGEMLKQLNLCDQSIDTCKIPAAHLGRLICLIKDGVISGKIGKTVFEKMFVSGLEPEAVIKSEGLSQITDAQTIKAIIQTIIDDNPQQVAQYRAGKQKVMGFFVGQVMKSSKGMADPAVVNQLLNEMLREKDDCDTH